ncbi:COP1-interacting protein 7 [Neltuma alba]|uniref:COP1-interacting protein 7 n=1 Tax=Neltuma alba TaxID=207710 RepID=UPI0010A39007|nr:COP1-interacting protein 7-like [Prosopis alba]
MDSKAVLDYALFQLTPTRTRCELVVFSGGAHEKIASGLFDPFVSHLKFAKDEISKGGYSIKLLPPTLPALWFSKATFERFVRFVSTPAILERFGSIEKEIMQTESSYDANKLSMSNVTFDEGIVSQSSGNASRLSDSSKLNGELEGCENKEEENSKMSLQRLLESRLALLRKEQAMAYARGLVAGFEIDNIDDLICFANAFGASRLREACIGFKELWKKKHGDDLWIKEVAAMQSCLPPALSFSGASGIILANEVPTPDQNKIDNSKESLSSSDDTSNSSASNRKEDDKLPPSDQVPSYPANVQMPMPWPYNVPPFMYNLQSPMQQVPPYPGYPLTNMQSVPPYLLRNMHWPSNLENSNVNLPRQSNSQKKKSSATRKEKSLYKQESEDLEDQQTESSDPDSMSESDSDGESDSKHSLKDDSKKKKHRRRSGTVVIRNINYITPNKKNGNEGKASDESSIDDDDVIDEKNIKQKVNIALESLQKVHKVDKHANKKNGVAQSNGASEPELRENMSDASEGGKTNENWAAFQNLLKIDEDTGNDAAERLQPIDVQADQFVARNSEDRMSYAADPSHDLEFKKVPKQMKVPNDSFIVTQRDGGNEGGAKFDDYVDSRAPIGKSRDNMGEEIMFSHRSEESGNDIGYSLSTCVSNSSVNKFTNAEDWFVADHSENTKSLETAILPAVFDGDRILSSVDSHAEKRNGSTPVDDSFMIQGQLAHHDRPDSQWKTDISIVADLNSAGKLENDAHVSQSKHESLKNQEPNDLCVVLQRDSGLGPVEASWTMDYEIDFSYTDRRSSVDDLNNEVNKNLPGSPKKINKNKVPATRNSAREEKTKPLRGSLGRGRPEIFSRNKKPSTISRPIVHKSKLEQEEETRKRMEELLAERQRRIAERTAASGLARATSKKDQVENKIARVSARSDKNRTQSMKETNKISSVRVRAA